MAETPHPPADRFSTHRLDALSDGIFSITMTILVLELHLPEGSLEELPRQLIAQWPTFLCYLISFFILGIYWVGHQNQFKYIREMNHNLLWINIPFLAVVVLVPFSTTLISRFPFAAFPQLIYGANLVVVGLMLFWHWRRGLHLMRLLGNEVPRSVQRYGALRCLLAPLCYLIAMGVSLIDPQVSLIMFALVPPLYIIPFIQRLWLRLTGNQ